MTFAPESIKFSSKYWGGIFFTKNLQYFIMKQTIQISTVVDKIKSLSEKEQTQIKGGVMLCDEKRPNDNANINAFSR